MASFQFDNVKAQKEDALRRYNMEMKLRIGLRFIGFSLFLFLLSWPWFPTLILDTVEAAGDFGRRFVANFNRPFFTFIILNITIVAVYVLSIPKKTHKRSSTTTNDIYDDYVSSRRSMTASTVFTAAISNSPIAVVKQIVVVENAVAVSQVKHRPAIVDTVTETEISLLTVKKQPTRIRTEVSSAEVKPKHYRRTRSMVSESRHERPRDREFRRSDTTVSSRQLAASCIEPPRKSMEDMSSEEFQLIIDSFIAERKKTLMQENTPRRKESIVS
ncbi:hypothetical protein like AT5G66440 [Hibiscus trionum]|uniref:CYP722 protein n=1 Tax=Hibiscus trionum TaxID=183268 RepID=A0A9W7M6T1_HIBTR|nr:hypothetical protein like AT5G66440 [Hibiscus trionum]